MTDEQSKPTKRSVAVGCDGDDHVKEQPQLQSDKGIVEATSVADQTEKKLLVALLPDSAPRILSTQAAASTPLPLPDIPTSSLHHSNNSCDEHSSSKVEASLSMTPRTPPEVVSSSQSSQPPLPPSSVEEQLDRRLVSSLSASSPLSQPPRVTAVTTSVVIATAPKTPPVAGISVGSFDDSIECFSLSSPSHHRSAADKENDELAYLDSQGSDEAVVPLQALRSRLEEIEYALTQQERAFAEEFGSEALTKI